MWRRATDHQTEHDRPRGGLRRWVAFTGAVIAATAGLTVVATSASAHDAPPTGHSSCAPAGTDWQVTDGATFVENAAGSFWQISFATTAGHLDTAPVTGHDNTATGPNWAVTAIPSTVDSIKVTTTLVWGASAGNYTQGSDQHSTTINRPDSGCVNTVAVPGQPTVHPGTCSTVGSLDVPADTDSVTWNATPAYHNGDTGTFTLTATATSGNVFSDGKTTETYPVTVPGKDAGANCDTEVTPAAPTLAQSECTGPGSNSVPTATIPTTTGVSYTIAGKVVSGTIPETPGTTIIVTAVPDTGYKFAGAEQSIQTTLTFTNPGDCAVTATPVAPTLAQSACTGPGTNTAPSLTIPVTTGVIYKIANTVVSGTTAETPGTTVTVTAVPATGYTFAGDQSKNYPLTFTNPGNCAVAATPVGPGISEIACNGPGSDAHSTLSIPTTTGVSYQINGATVSGDIDETGVSSVVVTAVPAAGYFFDTNTVSSWTEHFTTPDCSAAVTIVKPAFADDECVAGQSAGNAEYVIPGTDHVTYYVNGTKATPGSHAATNGSTIKVTATPDTGYTVISVSSWTHTFATPHCRGTDAVSVHRTPTTPTTPGALASTGVPTSSLLIGGGAIVLLGIGFLLAGGVTGRRNKRV